MAKRIRRTNHVANGVEDARRDRPGGIGRLHLPIERVVLEAGDTAQCIGGRQQVADRVVRKFRLRSRRGIGGAIGIRLEDAHAAIQSVVRVGSDASEGIGGGQQVADDVVGHAGHAAQRILLADHAVLDVERAGRGTSQRIDGLELVTDGIEAMGGHRRTKCAASPRGGTRLSDNPIEIVVGEQSRVASRVGLRGHVADLVIHGARYPAQGILDAYTAISGVIRIRCRSAESINVLADIPRSVKRPAFDRIASTSNSRGFGADALLKWIVEVLGDPAESVDLPFQVADFVVLHGAGTAQGVRLSDPPADEVVLVARDMSEGVDGSNKMTDHVVLHGRQGLGGRTGTIRVRALDRHQLVV